LQKKLNFTYGMNLIIINYVEENAMNIKTVMSTTNLVYALQDEKPSEVHKHKMSEKPIHHIPIVDNNGAKLLRGIV
jgi:hypothetical protein